MIALEQAPSVTEGTQMAELAHAWINYMLSGRVQRLIAEELRFRPVRREMALAERLRGKLPTMPEQVATLIRMPWQWDNSAKDRVEERVNRIFRG
ncbi:MAG: hypothetical protein N2Z67_11335 [Acetobacteraceae bacterium]|nr:hypothetical protein [Acetobacteraceae bacterium]